MDNGLAINKIYNCKYKLQIQYYMLSPRKINRGSPTKQNQSPTAKNPASSLQKQQKTPTPEQLLASIHELQCLIIRLGGKIPAHLNYGFTPLLGLIPIQPSEPTESVLHELKQELKSTKLALNNTQFQLKKLEEDAAEYKIVTRMQHEKEIKKFKEEIMKLEAGNRGDNSRWEAKVVEMREIYERNAEGRVREARGEMEREMKRVVQESQAKVEQLVRKYEPKIKQLTEQKQQQVTQLQQTFQQKLSTAEQTHLHYIQTLEQTHQQTVHSLQKAHQNTLINHQTDKKSLQKSQQQQKLAFNRQKQKLYNDLYLVRREKEELNERIVGLRAELLQAGVERERIGREMREMEVRFGEEIGRLGVSRVYEIEKVKAEYRMELKQVLKQHEKKLAAFQSTIQTLNALKTSHETLLTQSTEQLQKKFQDRPPRPQDTASIQKLNYELMNKQEQLNEIKNQLKQIKMERENNQRNYTRIFSAQGARDRGGERERGLTERERVIERPMTGYSRDKERMYSKVNTIDMSFLSKVCNKNF